MNVYLAGRMRGVDADIVKLLFTTGADKLRRMGHTCFSPYEHDVSNGFEFTGTVEAEQAFVRKALKADLVWICETADAVALLPDWERGTGTWAEHWTAKAIGIEVWLPESWFYDEPDVGGGDIPRPKRDPGSHMARELELRQQEWDSKVKAYA